MKLYTLNYNLYSNRDYKQEASLAAYLAHDTDYYVEEDIVNFNYADGVKTTQVLLDYNLSTDKNYAILCNDNDNIESRWFITESSYNSKWQYTVTLVRDVLVDFPDWKTSVAKIHRGWLTDVDSPLMYQKENTSYNQIKTGQQLLYDNTETPWVVFYLKDNFGSSDEKTIQKSVTIDRVLTETFESFQEDYPTVAASIHKEDTKLTVKVNFNPAPIGRWNNTWKATSYADGQYVPAEYTDSRLTTDCLVLTDVSASRDDETNAAILEAFSKSRVADQLAESLVHDITEYEAWQGKVVKFSDGTVKRINITSTRTRESRLLTTAEASTATNVLLSAFPGRYNSQLYGQAYTFTVAYDEVSLEYLDVDTGNVGYKFTCPGTVCHTSDSVCNILTMPLRGATLKYQIDSSPIVTVNISEDDSLAIAMGMTSSEDTSGALYDVQILPYCPVPEVTSSEIFIIDRTGISTRWTDNYVIVRNGDDEIVQVLLSVNHASFQKRLVRNFTASMVDRDPITTKVANDTRFARLCSPNYASAFDITYVQNRPTTSPQCLSKFNVTCTYKPYEPYIKIVPEFSGLYGRNFTDPRGLILGGSFNIDIMENALAQYRATNKNFQAIFDREIQSLELQQGIQRKQEIISGIVGAAQAGVTTGALVGGRLGVAAGIGTGLLSAGAAAADLYYNDQLRQETLSMRKDTFTFQLDNIKATPNTITRSTSFNIDSLYVPFVEFYNATATEENLLRNYLDMYGMTINVVDTVRNYMAEGKWLSCTPIKLYGNYDDHMAETIKNELTTGVYVWE